MWNFHDAYISVREALKHAALHIGVDVDIQWIHSTELERSHSDSVLQEANGIIVPGGFGSRGLGGKLWLHDTLGPITSPISGYAWECSSWSSNFARYIFQNERANSTEFDQSTPYPVIDLMPDQQKHNRYGGNDAAGIVPLCASTRYHRPTCLQHRAG